MIFTPRLKPSASTIDQMAGEFASAKFVFLFFLTFAGWKLINQPALYLAPYLKTSIEICTFTIT
jgi:uncharacterized membrane protein